MSDDADSPEPTPRNAEPDEFIAWGPEHEAEHKQMLAILLRPHADIERVASGAIGRPVVVTEHSPSAVSLLAPADTTKHGEAAIRRAVAAHVGPNALVFVTLDDPPPAA